MKLRAVINIEFDAADYADAADFQQNMRTLLGRVRDDYSGAALELKECRKRRHEASAQRLAATSNVRSLYGTGKSHIYEDLP